MTRAELDEQPVEHQGFGDECSSALEADCMLIEVEASSEPLTQYAVGPFDYVVVGVAIGIVVSCAFFAAFFENWLVFVRQLDQVDVELEPEPVAAPVDAETRR